MTTTVAVIAAGEMGCSIGERLRRHGAHVLTSLAHRSAATFERATRAGLIDADDDAIAAADFILSIVPPKDAMAIAQRFQVLCSAARRRPCTSTAMRSVSKRSLQSKR